MKKYIIYRHTAEARPDLKYWYPGKAVENDFDMERVEAEFNSLQEAQAEFQKSWYEPSASSTGMAYNLMGIEEFSLWEEDDEAETCKMLDARYYEIEE